MGYDPSMSARRRLSTTLFGGAALGVTGYIAAATVSGLAVEEITGSAALAGLPGAIAVAGTAVGATLLTARVAERGRRPGLIAGYLVAVAGAFTALLAVVNAELWLLLAGMLAMGIGHASNQLARYTAAEMFPSDRRASALSLIVWAGTVGSVLGPVLLEPGGSITSSRGYSELAGGYLVTIVFMGLAALLYTVALRPDPATLAFDGPTKSAKHSLTDVFKRTRVRVALAAMVTGQVVMVLIMTATPLHIRHHGFSLGIVGLVMSAHTLGMFAFSPVTGRLTDRFGHSRIVLAGLVMLGVSAVLAALAPSDSTPLLLVALFLLGLGWNFSFVAGSALLTVGIAPEVRPRLQGRADSITWLASALAAISSGLLFELTDYRLLAVVGLALLAVPLVVVSRQRTEVAHSTAS